MTSFSFPGLFLILAVVLLGPFLVRKIEEELEIFLFIMGSIAVTITSQWELGLIKEALVEPVKIALAVLAAGFIFRSFRDEITQNVNKIADAIGLRTFSFLVIVLLGLVSSVITAIIAALVLVAVIGCLTLERKHEIKIVILACYSIGLGAALTPIGEPLSTIVIAKLRPAPYYADFFFLLKNLWLYIVSGVLLFGFLGAAMVPLRREGDKGMVSSRGETPKEVIIRAVKVYFFVMALIFLGKGFKPIIDVYISRIPYQGLYWLNSVSAILDNATLAAAEIGPNMGLLQLKAAIIGLLIAGGMLIPGNIPNIISAGKLKIKSSEWARFGVPVGLIVMAVYFFLLVILH
ncbi:MAG: DUF1646 family protein [Candidatus Omnitrophica bacterium]|nr:DUF1646 family protein [Candidatus Omnitrophota bacterium]